MREELIVVSFCFYFHKSVPCQAREWVGGGKAFYYVRYQEGSLEIPLLFSLIRIYTATRIQQRAAYNRRARGEVTTYF